MPKILAAALLLVGSACSVNLGVDDTSQVTCASDDECPSGFACNSEGRCVSSDRSDVDPPGFSNATITPAIGNGTAPFVVTFEVTEELSGPPEISITDSGGTRALTATAGAPVYSYELTTTDPLADGTYPVSIRMADNSGNITATTLGVSVVLDATAPTVSDATDPLLTPPPGSILNQVTSAARDAGVALTVTSSEPLATASLLTLDSAGAPVDAGITFNWNGTGVAQSFSLDWTASPSAVDGVYGLRVTMTDPAGNVGAHDLTSSLIIDTTAPADPEVDLPGAIVFRRRPWGTDDTGGVEQHELTSLAAAFEPFSTVVVSSDGAGVAEIVRASADMSGMVTAQGGGRLILPITDRLEVYVRSVDAAGNTSAILRVRDVEWTATMTNKVVGSVFENPHRFETRALFTPALAQADFVLAGDIDGLGVRGDAALVTQGAGTWFETNTASVAGRYMSEVAYDPSRKRILIFGGTTGGDVPTTSSTLNELRDGNLLAVPIIDPEFDGNPGWGSTTDSMVFDVRANRLIRFDTGRVWRFNGSSWAGTDIPDPEGDGNPFASTLRTVYDEGRELTVGINGQAGFTTWEWNGTSWRQVCGTSPCSDTLPAGSDHHFVYDRANERPLVIGGRIGPTALAQVWTWDGQTWSDLCTPALCDLASPLTRFRYGVVHGPGADDLTLVGGCVDDGCSQYYVDTWRWDGTLWSCITPPQCDDPACMTFADVCDAPFNEGVDDGYPLLPQGTITPQLEWDQFRDKLVLLGGEDGRFGPGSPDAANVIQVLDDDGNWPCIAGCSPPGRTGGSAGTGTEPEVVLFGGDNGGGGNFVDTWIHSDGLWVEQCAPLPCGNPPGMSHAGFDYQSSTDGIVLAGGRSGISQVPGVWRWDFATDTWFTVASSSQPTVVLGKSMVVRADTMDPFWVAGDPSAGGTRDETWVHDGTTWQQLCPVGGCSTNPAVLEANGLAWDPMRDEAVFVIGLTRPGECNFTETWIWSAMTGEWTELTVTTPGRFGGQLLYHPAREKVVFVGGTTGEPNCLSEINLAFPSRVDEWDGLEWRTAPLTDPYAQGLLPGRTEPAASVRGGTDEVLLFGGGATQDDTWTWDSAANDRAAQVMSTSFSGARTLGDEEIVAIEVVWDAGGVGYPTGDGTPVTGTQLYMWADSDWVAVEGQNTADVTAPAALNWTTRTDSVWSTRDAAALRRLFIDRQQQLHLALTPAAPNGSGTDMGSVATDYVEVRVSYRLP